MATVRLKITPPQREWFARLSTEFPEDAFTLLTVTDTGDELFGIFEAETDDVSAVLSTLDSIDRVLSHELLHADDSVAVIQYTTTESIVYAATVNAGVVPVCPVSVQDGEIFVEATLSHENLSYLGEHLTTVDATFELCSVSQLVGSETLLTDSQWQFVTEAVERGYYDTPRRCTLTELAATMGVTTGAASGMAHRTEERIIKEFVRSAEIRASRR